ncbi:MAG: hypothetical protein SCK70_06250 [bacterium]|nr:hypothetical protein [bacterium]
MWLSWQPRFRSSYSASRFSFSSAALRGDIPVWGCSGETTGRNTRMSFYLISQSLGVDEQIVILDDQ